jgi:hypothetical protein
MFKSMFLLLLIVPLAGCSVMGVLSAPVNTPTSAPTVVPTVAPSATPAPSPTTTPAPVSTGLLTWASLATTRPLWIQTSENLAQPQVFADPANPNRLAYCQPGAIRLTTDGGATWTTIPTTSADNAKLDADLAIWKTNDAEPACAALLLDPIHPKSFYAMFDAVMPQYGAPPIYKVGLVTTDGGQTWNALTSPDGSVKQFGGFQMNGQLVEAIFSKPARSAQPPGMYAEQSIDGGKTWKPESLTCPATGPCVRSGPGVWQITGMGAPRPQWIEYSTDQGHTWQVSDSAPSVELGMGGLNQLAALSSTKVALISALDDHQFEVSNDGGETWQPVALPSMIGSKPDFTGYEGLQILPDGSLLAYQPDAKTWQLLAPQSSSWCEISGATMPGTTSGLTVSGDRVWWMTSPSQPGAIPTPKSISSQDLRCAK